MVSDPFLCGNPLDDLFDAIGTFVIHTTSAYRDGEIKDDGPGASGELAEEALDPHGLLHSWKT